MLCQNKFCIYEENGKCILNETELDINGTCEECIYVNISTEILEEQKNKLRNSFDISK